MIISYVIKNEVILLYKSKTILLDYIILCTLACRKYPMHGDCSIRLYRSLADIYFL